MGHMAGEGRDTGKHLCLTLAPFPRSPPLCSLALFVPDRSPHSNITIKAWERGEYWEWHITGCLMTVNPPWNSGKQ